MKITRIRIKNIFCSVRGVRRAVSPVIATVFLMGIIVASIGAVLTIIYPNLRTIDDQIAINETSTHLRTFDDAIRTLIIQAEGTEKLIQIRSEDGTIMGDDKSTMTIIPFMNGTDMSSFVTTIPYPRLVIQNSLSSNIYAPNVHQYLRGTYDQDFFVLNETTVRTTPWVILNISRPSDLLILNSSLSYRLDVSNSFQGGNSVITTLTYIRFNFPGEIFRSLSINQIKMVFNGVVETPIFSNLYNTNAGNIKLSVSTSLVGDTPHLDVPVQYAGSSFFWSLNLRYFDISITFS